jgi:hypothetical protein
MIAGEVLILLIRFIKDPIATNTTTPIPMTTPPHPHERSLPKNRLVEFLEVIRYASLIYFSP